MEKELIYDEDIINADVKHSWAIDILRIPDEDQRADAIFLIDEWIDDEMDNLFDDMEDASEIVKYMWLYLLEREAISTQEILDEDDDFDMYPFIEDAADACDYFCKYIDRHMKKKEKTYATIFLRLMDDGYMKPNVEKVIAESVNCLPGVPVNVSLRESKC